MPEKTCNNKVMKDGKMKDVPISNLKSNNNAIDKLIQDQNDIKCAEIKTIPSVMNGFRGEKHKKNVFKIGEYNRATASFEISSTDGNDLRLVCSKSNRKPEFDLATEITPGHYFKSSFARSIIGHSNKSKSLDYATANRNGFSARDEPVPVENGNHSMRDFPNGKIPDAVSESFWQVPGKENWDLRRAQPAEIRDDESSTGSLLGEKQPKKADIIEEHLKQQQLLLDRPGSRASSHQRSSSGYSDVLLRSPLTASCRSSYRPHSAASDVDAVMLQSQVTTLQWQLRQAESSRQMHRAVLEQVVAFLQRTHRNLDLLHNRIAAESPRVPRSRSVHAVDSSPSRLASPRSESDLSFQKAQTIIQGDLECPRHGSALRDMTWRRARKQQQFEADEISPSKLSEEAFRLLRTVQSLLNTREPDLTSRLNGVCSTPPNVADASSASSTVSAALDSDNSDNFQSQETLRNRTPIPPNQLEEASLQSAFGGNCSPIPGLSAAHLKDATMSLGRRRRHRASDSNSFSDAKGSPPQLSISSADDESGFSSLNSFQEVGLPVSNSTFNGMSKNNCQIIPEDNSGENGSVQELGLPRVEGSTCKIHRRWSSTPADGQITKMRPASLCTTGDVIRVLWV